jgi:hypothetical protein
LPKRLIDYDAIWASDKLASCPEWAIPEYTWLYGIADATGCFELSNLRVLWGKVSAIRPNLTLSHLKDCLDVFHEKGLLFIWEANGKTFGHWTGSTKGERLPPPSQRNRYKHIDSQVPQNELHQYEDGFTSRHDLSEVQTRLALGLGSHKVSSRAQDSSLVAKTQRGAGEIDQTEALESEARQKAVAPPAFESSLLTVTVVQDKKLADAYPWVDRPVEYRKAELWRVGHGNKTVKNVLAFLQNWFNKVPINGKGGARDSRLEREKQAFRNLGLPHSD